MTYCWFQGMVIILFFRTIKSSSYSLENSTRPHVSLCLLNDNKVMVDLGGGSRWRIIKTSRNQYQLGSVMCRGLGLGPPILPGYISDPNFDFHGNFIEADAFLCTGWEPELSECRWTMINKSISEQRWLNYSKYFMQVNCLPPQAEEFSVFLQKDLSSKNFGIPLIFFEGRWGPLCPRKSSADQYNINHVLCKQLGFSRANDFPYSYIVDVVYWPPLPLNVLCTGGEQSIQQCEYSSNTHSQMCDSFTRISCGPYDSNVNINAVGGGRGAILHHQKRYSAYTRNVSTATAIAVPDESTNIGLSVLILCVIIVVGGCILCSIFALCVKLLRTPAPTQTHHATNHVSQTTEAIRISPLQPLEDNRGHYITDVPPQYPIANPVLDPELPTYEEAMKSSTSLSNITVL